MNQLRLPNRRELLAAASATALATGSALAAERPSVLRIGVVSASNGGKPQRTNGHTWHFAQYFHPTVHFDALKKYLDPVAVELLRKHLRNPRENFDQLPFPDTRLAHVYDADPASAALFAEA